eukprot:GHVT01102155.1.p1 GENE.GHVT01102155.1~~GHVT01102155.1.p1  ORF type:complete len:717 (-),score=92.39 GHVT01102155.1:165-2315(-)
MEYSVFWRLQTGVLVPLTMVTPNGPPFIGTPEAKHKHERERINAWNNKRLSVRKNAGSPSLSKLRKVGEAVVRQTQQSGDDDEDESSNNSSLKYSSLFDKADDNSFDIPQTSKAPDQVDMPAPNIPTGSSYENKFFDFVKHHEEENVAVKQALQSGDVDEGESSKSPSTISLPVSEPTYENPVDKSPISKAPTQVPKRSKTKQAPSQQAKRRSLNVMCPVTNPSATVPSAELSTPSGESSTKPFAPPTADDDVIITGITIAPSNASVALAPVEKNAEDIWNRLATCIAKYYDVEKTDPGVEISNVSDLYNIIDGSWPVEASYAPINNMLMSVKTKEDLINTYSWFLHVHSKEGARACIDSLKKLNSLSADAEVFMSWPTTTCSFDSTNTKYSGIFVEERLGTVEELREMTNPTQTSSEPKSLFHFVFEKVFKSKAKQPISGNQEPNLPEPPPKVSQPATSQSVLQGVPSSPPLLEDHENTPQTYSWSVFKDGSSSPNPLNEFMFNTSPAIQASAPLPNIDWSAVQSVLSTVQNPQTTMILQELFEKPPAQTPAPETQCGPHNSRRLGADDTVRVNGVAVKAFNRRIMYDDDGTKLECFDFYSADVKGGAEKLSGVQGVDANPRPSLLGTRPSGSLGGNALAGAALTFMAAGFIFRWLWSRRPRSASGESQSETPSSRSSPRQKQTGPRRQGEGFVDLDAECATHPQPQFCTRRAHK